MKRTKTLVLFFASLAFLVGCSENVDTDSRYVFNKKTVMEYLSSHEEYSKYCELLKILPLSDRTATTFDKLLAARGHYTVFAPKNEAIQAFLDTLAANDVIDNASWDGFRSEKDRDSIRRIIVFNSVIDTGDDKAALFTSDFPTEQNAEIIYPNMNERKLMVRYGNDSEIYVNECLVDDKEYDMEFLNGVIHSMHSVISPSQSTLADYIKKVVSEKQEGYYVACLLANAVGLNDTLNVYEDYTFERLYKEGKLPTIYKRVSTADHRYVNFTYFAETDEFWTRTLGKPALDITIEDVVEYLKNQNIYPEAKRDNDYKSEDNLLNQFVTYHFLPQKLNTDRLVRHYNEVGYNPTTKAFGAVVYDYFTTMGKPRVLKTYQASYEAGAFLNRFPNLDNGRKGTYKELSCDPDKEGVHIGDAEHKVNNAIRNAIIYPLDKLLVYSEDVRRCFRGERLRFDTTVLSPEIINNDHQYKTVEYYTEDDYPYLTNVTLRRGTVFNHEEAVNEYQGDFMPATGNVDMTIKMPPVPTAGIYEVRCMQNAYHNRSIFQFYWGTDPDRLVSVGLPIDFRMGGQTMYVRGVERPSGMGWEPDVEDDEDYCAQIDRFLRAKDYMKSPKYFCNSPGSSSPTRDNETFLRRILLRQYMSPDEQYYLRLKSCIDDPDRFLVLDFFEYVAKEVFDNPEKPEDIW